MVAKRPLEGNGHVRVTFALKEPAAAKVQLLGDFTDWQSALRMRRLRDGTWRAELDLEKGREYGFRYLIDGSRWANDPWADKQVPNPFGSENSVVVV